MVRITPLDVGCDAPVEKRINFGNDYYYGLNSSRLATIFQTQGSTQPRVPPPHRVQHRPAPGTPAAALHDCFILAACRTILHGHGAENLTLHAIKSRDQHGARGLGRSAKDSRRLLRWLLRPVQPPVFQATENQFVAIRTP